MRDSAPTSSTALSPALAGDISSAGDIAFVSKNKLDLKDSPNLSPARAENLAKFIVRNFQELFRLKFALATFVVNNLRKRYHNSVLGFAWSLLNPLATMGVMTLIFSLIFGKDPSKFAVYLFSGMLPWSFIRGLSRA